jgi:hypothetical protein
MIIIWKWTYDISSATIASQDKEKKNEPIENKEEYLY